MAEYLRLLCGVLLFGSACLALARWRKR